MDILNKKSKLRQTGRWLVRTGVILLLSLVVIALTLDSAPGSRVPLNHDSSMFYYMGKGILHGLIPYRDMFDHKGPVLFFIEAMAALLSFNSLHFGLFIIELLTIGGILLCGYLTVRLVCGNDFAAALTVLLLTPFNVVTLQGGNFSEEYALFFAMSATYLWAWVLHNQQNGRIKTFLAYLWLGFSCAAVFFIRANMVALWIGIIIYAVVRVLLNHELLPELGRQVVGFVLGFLLLSIPLCLFFYLHGAFKTMVNDSLIMNFLYAQSTAAEKWKVAGIFMKLLTRSGALLLLLLGVVTVLLQSSQFSRTQLGWVLFIVLTGLLNFYTTVLSGRAYGHYLITEYSYILIMSGFALAFMLANVDKPRWITSAIAVLILLLALVFPSASKQINAHRNQPVPAQNVLDRQIAEYLWHHTSKHQQIYVHLQTANIYLNSGRFSNSRYYVLPSLNWNDYPRLQAGFRRSMRSNPPRYIVIPNWAINKDYNDSNMTGTVEQEIRRHYAAVSRFRWTASRVFVHK